MAAKSSRSSVSPLTVTVLGLVVLLLLSPSWAAPPAVSSATYQVRHGEVLLSTTVMGNFDVEVDQELYRILGTGVCPNKDCYDPVVENGCDSCDYTDPLVCDGTIRPPEDPCPCTSRDSNNNIYHVICNDIVTDPSLPALLELGVRYEFEMAYDSYHEFLINIPVRDTPCAYLNFDMIPHTGDPDLYVSHSDYYESSGQGFHTYGEIWGIEDYVYCPGHEHYRDGTYVIGAYSFQSQQFATGTSATFSLQITFEDMPPVRNEPACTVPAAHSSTHSCLTDSEYLAIDTAALDAAEVLYYTFEVPAGSPTTVYRDTNTEFFSSWTEPFPVTKDHPLHQGGGRFSPIDDWFLHDQGTQGIWRNSFSIYLTEPRTMYIAVLKYADDPYLYMSSHPDYTFLEPVSSMSHLEYAAKMHGTSRMVCEDQPEVDESVFHCSRRIIDQYPDATDCAAYYPTTPLEDPNPFFPRPPWTPNDDKWQELSWPEGQNLKGRPDHFTATLMVSHALSPLATPITRLGGDPSKLSTCKMYMMGNLANADREVFLLPDNEGITFTEREVSGEYEPVSELLQTYLTDIDLATGQDVTDIQFQLDLFAYSSAYTAAKAVGDSLYSAKSTTVPVDSTACLSPDDTDPCCNDTLDWTSTACAPRAQNIAVPVFESITSALSTACGQTDQGAQDETQCVVQNIQDWASIGDSASVQTCADNAVDVDYQSRLFRAPYRECRDLWLGEGPGTFDSLVAGGDAIEFPIQACGHDSECPDGILCDVVKKSCLVPIADRQTSFMSCLLDNLDPFILIQLSQLASVAQGETDPAVWLAAFEADECVDPFDFNYAWPHRSHANLRPDTVDITCPFCNRPVCFDTHCTVPTPCNVRFTTKCFQSWHTSDVDRDGCSDASVCNYDSTIESATLCTGNGTVSDFCAVCDNGADCYQLPLALAPTELQCTGVACFLADGSVTIEANEDACLALNTCDIAGLSTQADCTSGGTCSGSSVYGSGACALPANPWRNVDCDQGQLAYLEYCINYDVTESQCSGLGGEWKVELTTQADCEAEGNICLRPTGEAKASGYFNTFIHTQQNETDCALIEGAVWEPRHQWIAGKWLPGQPRQLSWTSPSFGPRWAVEQAFSIPTFMTTLDSAIDIMLDFQKRSFSFCRYGRSTATLGSLLCTCEAGSNAAISACYDGQTGSTANIVSSTTVCGGAASSVTSNPLRVSFFDDTVTPYGSCTNMDVLLNSASNYKGSFTKAATFFIDFSEETEWKFRNSNDALVGQVVGDGLSLLSSNDQVTLSGDLVICTLPRYDIPSLINAVADYAKTGTGTQLIPLEVNTTVNSISGEYCATIPAAEFTPGVSFFPVQRSSSWETDEHVVFEDGEFAMLIITIVAYVAVLVFAGYKMYPVFRLKKFTFGVGNVIPLLLLYVVRLIYFILLASGALSVNESSVGVFILVELPILLYFCTTAYFVVNWMFLTRTIKKLGNARKLAPKIVKGFSVFAVVLLLLFILFVILFAVLASNPRTICGGSVVVTDNTDSKTISTVYRLTMAVLCVILGTGFLVYGAQLHCRIKENQALQKAKRNIYILASLCSVSLIVSAVFLVIVALIDNFRENVLAMIVMIVIEIIPGIGILFLLDVRALARAQTNTSSLSSFKTTGKKSLYSKQTGGSAGSTTDNMSHNSTTSAAVSATSSG